MSDNKSTLKAANAAITIGDIEGFLSYCAEDIVWTTVGESTLEGKAAVRRWMQDAYVKAPAFTVTDMIAEGDLVIATGEIAGRSDNGLPTNNLYCDVWRFRDGKMVELKAFVIEV